MSLLTCLAADVSSWLKVLIGSQVLHFFIWKASLQHGDLRISKVNVLANKEKVVLTFMNSLECLAALFPVPCDGHQ